MGAQVSDHVLLCLSRTMLYNILQHIPQANTRTSNLSGLSNLVRMLRSI